MIPTDDPQTVRIRILMDTLFMGYHLACTRLQDARRAPRTKMQAAV